MHGRVGGDAVGTVAQAGNNLLRALRPADLAILDPYLEPWIGRRGEIIYEPGYTVTSVYFPCASSMISYLVVLQNGMGVEAGLVGREGAVGGMVSRGRLPAFARAEVQFPGPFLRMAVADLENAKQRSATLDNLRPARLTYCSLSVNVMRPSSEMGIPGFVITLPFTRTWPRRI